MTSTKMGNVLVFLVFTIMVKNLPLIKYMKVLFFIALVHSAEIVHHLFNNNSFASSIDYLNSEENLFFSLVILFQQIGSKVFPVGNLLKNVLLIIVII